MTKARLLCLNLQTASSTEKRASGFRNSAFGFRNTFPATKSLIWVPLAVPE